MTSNIIHIISRSRGLPCGPSCCNTQASSTPARPSSSIPCLWLRAYPTGRDAFVWQLSGYRWCGACPCHGSCHVATTCVMSCQRYVFVTVPFRVTYVLDSLARLPCVSILPDCRKHVRNHYQCPPIPLRCPSKADCAGIGFLLFHHGFLICYHNAFYVMMWNPDVQSHRNVAKPIHTHNVQDLWLMMHFAYMCLWLICVLRYICYAQSHHTTDALYSLHPTLSLYKLHRCLSPAMSMSQKV